MNLGDVKTRVKRIFGDESAVQVTDADITRWANDAQRAIVLSNEGLLEQIATLNLVADQQEYSLPSDCLILSTITCKNSTQLSYFRLHGYSLTQFNEYVDGWDGTTFGSGQPSIYTVFASMVRLFPVPSTAVVNGLKFFYCKNPPELVNDADVLSLPLVYHNAVVNFCLKNAYELDEDWQTSGLKGSQVVDDMHLARNRDAWKNQETYPTITILSDDGW